MKTAPRASSPRRPASIVSKVTNLCIWGNHSATQYPDFTNAKIDGKPGHRSHHRPRVAQGRVHHHRPAARCRHHQGPRRIVRRLRRECRHGHRAQPHHPDSRRRLAFRRRLLGRFLRHRKRPHGLHADPHPRGRQMGSRARRARSTPSAKGKIDATIDELKEERDAVKDLIPG